MVTDKELEALREIARNQRPYAGFWSGGGREIVERAIARQFVESAEECTNVGVVGLRPSGEKAPDIILTCQDGSEIDLEITELVERGAIELAAQGEKPFVWWSDETFRERLTNAVADKDRKAGGPGERRWWVLVHTSEWCLDPGRVALMLAHFPTIETRRVDKAFLMLSYRSGVGYPVFDIPVSTKTG